MCVDKRLNYNGVRFDLSFEVISTEIREAIAEEWYEAHEARLIEEYLPPATDVIELGAGIGYVSCVIDSVVADERTQIAVEPNPAVIPVLKRTKQLNKADYTIYEYAYASTTNSVALTLTDAFWTATTHTDQRDVGSIQAVSLETICEQQDLTTFSLIVDIEGAEYELFCTELPLLEKRCRLLIVEYHDTNPYSTEYTDELDRSAFELVDGIEDVCVYRNTRFD